MITKTKAVLNETKAVWEKMQPVRVGVIGLGNVGSGTLAMLAENAEQIALKLGFPLRVTAVCSRSVAGKKLPESLGSVQRTTDWREVVAHPEVEIVAELVGGTGVAAEIIDGAIAHRKSVVTANKELMAELRSGDLGPRHSRRHQPGHGSQRGGGIPIHAVLREGISGDRVVALYGILNGTCNYILTEMEKRGAPLDERAGGGAAAGLRRGRPERRYRRLRRALEAGHPGGPGVRRKDHAVGHFRGRHPAHLAARFPVRAPVGAHHPADLRSAADAGRTDSFGAAGADRLSRPSWPACRERITPCG